MVFNVSALLGSSTGPSVVHRPLLNQIPTNYRNNTTLGVSSLLTQKQKFWRWFKSRPELNAPVAIRVDDTIGQVEFFKPDGSPLGRNKRLEAENFWRDNQFYERLKSVQYDRLVTGSGFLWMGKLDVDQLREVIESYCDNIWLRGINMREVATDLFVRTLSDEDVRTTRKVDYVASSTMQIEYDDFTVKRYVQWFNAKQAVFTPEEIIHIPLHIMDGKVDGFSSVESLGHELVLIWAIKENMLSYFRNGGSPSKAWILPEEFQGSDNFEWLNQQLMNQGQLENRHGNMVLAGKVEIENLEGDIKDMDYEKLALWCASNIAYALRIPVSRIPYLVGSASSKGDAGGLAESGYWSMIESDQRTIEMHLNQQLFIPMGFMIKFKKQYKLDDVREAQTLQLKVDAVTKMNELLHSMSKELTPGKVSQFLDLAPNDITDFDKMEEFEMTAKMNGQIANNEVMPDQNKQDRNEKRKQDSQANNANTTQSGT